MVAYTGIETISNMAEEARDYGKTIPRGIGGVVVAVAVIYASCRPWRCRRCRWRTGRPCSPCPRRRAATPTTRCSAWWRTWTSAALQGAAEIYVGMLAATILFIATNAGLIGVSRLTYSMGQYRQLPERLRQLHPRYRTPYVAILVFGAMAALAIVPGQAEFLGMIYAFGAMLSFTIAHVSVCVLRVTQPDHERPYRSPGNLRIARRGAAAAGGSRRARHRQRARGGRGAGPGRAGPGTVWLAIGLVATCCTGAARG